MKTELEENKKQFTEIENKISILAKGIGSNFKPTEEPTRFRTQKVEGSTDVTDAIAKMKEEAQKRKLGKAKV